MILENATINYIPQKLLVLAVLLPLLCFYTGHMIGVTEVLTIFIRVYHLIMRFFGEKYQVYSSGKILIMENIYWAMWRLSSML